MDKQDSIKLFNDTRVRVHWDNDKEKWYFSKIDVIEVLTGNEQPRKYWSDLKKKLKVEGSEVSEKIGQLKMEASNVKQRKTDVADTQTLLRLIQSIPSPKGVAKRGGELIEYTKTIDEKYNYVEEKRDKQKELALKTMYKKKKNT